MSMRLINKILGKTSPLYKRKEDINLTSLQQIIDDVEYKRKSVTFVPLTLNEAEISFMPTKGHSFIGLDDGLWDCYERERNTISLLSGNYPLIRRTTLESFKRMVKWKESRVMSTVNWMWFI